MLEKSKRIFVTSVLVGSLSLGAISMQPNRNQLQIIIL